MSRGIRFFRKMNCSNVIQRVFLFVLFFCCQLPYACLAQAGSFQILTHFIPSSSRGLGEFVLVLTHEGKFLRIISEDLAETISQQDQSVAGKKSSVKLKFSKSLSHLNSRIFNPQKDRIESWRFLENWLRDQYRCAESAFGLVLVHCEEMNQCQIKLKRLPEDLRAYFAIWIPLPHLRLSVNGSFREEDLISYASGSGDTVTSALDLAFKSVR